MDITNNQLPTSAVSPTFDLNLTYKQADSNAVAVQHVNRFAMDEWNGQLRLATSEYHAFLTILEASFSSASSSRFKLRLSVI